MIDKNSKNYRFFSLLIDQIFFYPRITLSRKNGCQADFERGELDYDVFTHLDEGTKRIIVYFLYGALEKALEKYDEDTFEFHRLFYFFFQKEYHASEKALSSSEKEVYIIICDILYENMLKQQELYEIASRFEFGDW